MELYAAKEEQLAVLVRLSKEAFESDVLVGAPKGDCPPDYDSVPWHQKMMEEGHLFAAMEGGTIVGGAILFPDESSFSVYVGRIFVDPKEFRKGYGIAIMKAVEALFPKARSFRLDTPEWNIRTNRFYQKLGYQEEKREDGFVYYCHKK